ncbi:SdpI family protein [Dyadobacter luteus]|nr:SdpI family protein [Dyadobacter luteus]
MDMNTILLGHIALAVTFLGITLFFRAKQPQNINSFYGYRTHVSMKNAEIWKEANAFSSDLFVKFSFIFIIFETISYLLIGGINSFYISATFLTIISIAVIPLTEIHIRKKFDKNGRAKN